MSKRLEVLLCTLVGAVASASIGLVTYFNPSTAEAINSSISVAEAAIITILGNFVINNQSKLPK